MKGYSKLASHFQIQFPHDVQSRQHMMLDISDMLFSIDCVMAMLPPWKRSSTWDWNVRVRVRSGHCDLCSGMDLVFAVVLLYPWSCGLLSAVHAAHLSFPSRGSPHNDLTPTNPHSLGILGLSDSFLFDCFRSVSGFVVLGSVWQQYLGNLTN